MFDRSLNLTLRRALVACALLAIAMSAARAAGEPRPIQEVLAQATPAERALLNRALSVPPEFGADVLLKTVARVRPAGRSDWLSVAWRLAEQAPQPFPALARVSDSAVGTIAEHQEATGLDRLSLQSRVITAWAGIDGPAALSRFQVLSLAGLPPRHDCDVDALADPGPYYEAATAVAGRLSTVAEQQAFVLQALAGVRLPSQLAPALRLTGNFPRATPADRVRLAAALTSAFNRVRGDDPLFSNSSSAVLVAYDHAMRAFDPADRQTAALRTAARNYLLAHYQAPRCRAHIEGDVFAQETQDLLAHRDALGLQASQIDDLHRATAYLPAPPHSPGASPAPGESYYVEGWRLAQQILDAPPASANHRDQVQAAQAYFDSLRRAPVTDTPGFDLYRSRVGALRRFADLMPDDDIRVAAQQTLFDLLESSPLYAVDRAAWFQDAKALVDRVETASRTPQDPLVRRLAQSSNPVLRLYGEVAAQDPVSRSR